jgi:CTP:molybdopterin cytidylyltransferase MocA
MARIIDTLSRERDQFAYELFLQKSENGNPVYSPKDVNAKLQERDGFRLGAIRLYQLRDAAVAGQPIPAKASHCRTPEDKAQRKADRKANREARKSA